MTKDKTLIEKRKTKKPKVTYTTGDPDLNIAFFNKRMGTDFEADKLAFTQADLDNSSELSMVATSEAGEAGTLAEAKKKKKRKKRSPRVVHVAGMPWFNDHMFNCHNGTCDCKDHGEEAADNINDAIGGGESVGDAGSADGEFGGDSGASDTGGMGESLVNEALTPLEKMKALEAGTRGFNAPAASDKKLADNLAICRANGLSAAADVMIREINSRIKAGVWSLGPITTAARPSIKKEISALVEINDTDLHPADLLFIKDNRSDIDRILNNIKDAYNPLEQAIITLLFALAMSYSDIASAVQNWILSEILKEDFKQIMINCTTNQKLLDKLTELCKEFMTEGVNKMNKLTEAKRETKRYYIRPQNIFCANKSDVLRALTEIDKENCSVYTLKNLEDHEDVHLLSNNDIIYYYDNEILYDKNKVKIMDYKLSIKSEEERKNFTGNVDKVSDDAFRREYDDRLTDRTLDLQEGLILTPSGWGIEVQPRGKRSEYGSENTATNVFNKLKELVKAEPYNFKPNYTVILYKNIGDEEIEEIEKFTAQELLNNLLKEEEPVEEMPMFGVPAEEIGYEDDFDAIEYPGIQLDDEIFEQDFEARNVFGEAVERKVCCICGEEYDGYGNNPAPYKDHGKCCDSCNIKFVIPARMNAEVDSWLEEE